MSVADIKKRISDGYYDDDFKTMYGETAAAAKRYSDALDAFSEIYGKFYGDKRTPRLFSAPGRTEVGGNHTDHQHGCVLAGSVNLDVIAVVAENEDRKVRIKSEGFPEDIIDLDHLEPDPAEFGHAAALIRGMCGIMEKHGYKVGGFDAYTTSNVLKGSGLSSSAAFEVLVGVIISHLFNNGAVSAVDIAKFAQGAENEYFGKPCGLMDQMASSVGGFTSIDFNDPKNPIINKVEFDLASHGHALCIVNTGGNHADLTGDYADITVGDREVAEFFGKEFLREVSEEEFYANIKPLREKLGDRGILCAIHFFADNRRAIDEAEALRKNDFEEFLRLVTESGNSSFKYLQNVFSTRFPNEQGLSIALAVTERFLKGKGACRVHGGGFAGTIQAFVPTEILAEYKHMIEKIFGENTCYVLNIRPVGGYALKV